MRALPIRSSSVLDAFSLPERTVTLTVVATRARELSFTRSLIVRVCAGLSADSEATLRTDSPRALLVLTVTVLERLEPSLATLSLSVIVRLRRIVDGAPSSETVSLASLATATGGVVAVVGAGTGVGAGGGAVVGAAVGVGAGGSSCASVDRRGHVVEVRRRGVLGERGLRAVERLRELRGSSAANVTVSPSIDMLAALTSFGANR